MAKKNLKKLVGKPAGVKTADSTSRTVPAQTPSAVQPAAPHLIVKARAGTGKTTTIVEGLKWMRGMETRITPSEQQQAVWDELAKSKDASTICLTAFNKSIADELKVKVPPGVDACTMHSLGMRCINSSLPRLKVNSYRSEELLAGLVNVHPKDLKCREPLFVQAVVDLVSLLKQTLADCDEDGMNDLIGHYNIDLEGTCRDLVFDYTLQVIRLSADPLKDRQMDFDDMVWFPSRLSLPVPRYDLLIVDEAQDLNRARQQLAKLAGNRLILVGDDRQAIYGFAGADAQSLQRMESELGSTGSVCRQCKGAKRTKNGDACPGCNATGFQPGCIVLPLTVTRRCCYAVVEEAQKIVPEFTAHPDNEMGLVSTDYYSEKSSSGVVIPGRVTYHARVEVGDMVLCRVNAPLVSQAFKFIRMGKKANIQGRDIGRGLVSQVNRLWKKEHQLTDFIKSLGDWLDNETRKEQAKRNPNETKLIGMQDRHDCLLCFTESLTPTATKEELTAKIESLFTDSKDSPGVRLSSIHKAKGLEADRVFFLRPKGGECPHPMAKSPWEKEQERNLLYVGITRAIKELVYVS